MKLKKPCSRNFLKFFEWACEYLKKHNKKLTIRNGKHIYLNKERCAGWCDGDEICVAGNAKLFEEIFVHEFCHMQQAIEESKYWVEDHPVMTNWESVFKVIQVERDCEMRAIRLSRKWKLFDNKRYAQKTNLYLYFYQYVFLINRWNNSTSIYKKQLIDLMPDKILPISKFKEINMEVMREFDRHLDKKNKERSIILE